MDMLPFDVEEISRAFLPDEKATEEAGRTLVRSLTAGDFVGFIGDLGAGKTCFIRGMLRELGAADDVQSPTYTLVNTYESSPPVHHFDLYRLEVYDDLEGIGYWDYLDGEHLILVEWLDRIPEAWPGNGIIAVLTHRQNARELVLYANRPLK